MPAQKILHQVDPLIQAGKYQEAIDFLEQEINHTENIEALCAVSRKLAFLYRYGDLPDGISKAVDYALVAGVGYIRSGRMGPAVAMLKWLREVCPKQKTIQDYRHKIAEAFCRPRIGRKLKGDEHLPPPTPYSEFRARVSLESFDGGEVRRQFDKIDAQKVPLFSVLEKDELAALLEVANVRDLAPNRVLFKEGDVAGAFYVVASGELELRSEAGFQKVFQEGDFFGEVALLGGMRRTATIETKTGAEVIEISKKDLDKAFQQLPHLEAKIFNFYEHRLFLNVAARSLFFSGFSEEELEEVLDFFIPIHIPNGKTLIEEKTKSDRAFFVVKGFVEISTEGLAKSRLGPGHFVGEMGLIRQIPRTAQVVALADCHLLECDYKSFQALTKRFPKVLDLVQSLVKVRADSNDVVTEETGEIDASDYLVVD